MPEARDVYLRGEDVAKNGKCQEKTRPSRCCHARLVLGCQVATLAATQVTTMVDRVRRRLAGDGDGEDRTGRALTALRQAARAVAAAKATLAAPREQNPRLAGLVEPLAQSRLEKPIARARGTRPQPNSAPDPDPEQAPEPPSLGMRV